MKYSAFVLAILSAIPTCTCDGNTLNIGIIYDNELGISGEALMRRFDELSAKMEYYADYPIRNFSLPSPPALNITVNEFTVGQVCNLIERNVHVIISLTTCSVAQLIESQTSPHRITHVAIPRPACSKDSIDSSALSASTTIWIQPTPEHTSRAIYEL
uniref:ANF_receptor domain-containing protein n=1 Tax=Trichobilharzia regenti TaxID=157069 RepID=A0AA85J1I8_TRIRE